MSVLEAVERDLALLPSDIAVSAMAALAVALAREIDDPENSATSKSMCARALTETLDKLLARAPAKKETSPLDEIRAARARKLARLPKPTGRVDTGGGTTP